MNLLKKISHVNYALLWVLISIFSRLIPHPFDASASISLALWAPLFFNRYYGLAISVTSLLLADLSLHLLAGYPTFGTWSLFTYTAIVALALFNRSHGKHMLLITIFGALGFWLWTNFGTWLMTNDLYPKTWLGLLDCYIAGLPFLKNSLIGSLAYSLILKYCYQYRAKKRLITT